MRLWKYISVPSRKVRLGDRQGTVAKRAQMVRKEITRGKIC
jgi:hypothetical protein